MQIPINIEDLKSICQSMTRHAQQIIEQTKKVRIEETLIELKRQKDEQNDCGSADRPR